MNCIADVYQAIEDAGFSECTVIREAGLGVRYLRDIRAGRKPLTSRTIRRIKDALRELRRRRELLEKGRKGDGFEPWRSYSAAQYRLAVALVTFSAGVSPSFVLSSDPFRRATADPQWMRAANLRRIALYVTNQFLGVEQADLARAANMSKSNVHYTLKDIEDMRGDPELERVLAHVEEAFQ